MKVTFIMVEQLKEMLTPMNLYQIVLLKRVIKRTIAKERLDLTVAVEKAVMIDRGKTTADTVTTSATGKPVVVDILRILCSRVMRTLSRVTPTIKGRMPKLLQKGAVGVTNTKT